MAMASEHSEGTLASQNHQIPKAHSGAARDGLHSTVLGVWLLIAVKFAVEFLWNFLEGNSTLTKFRRNFAGQTSPANFAAKFRH